MASLIHRDTVSGFNTSSVVITSGSINMSGRIVAGDFLHAKVYMAANAGVLGGFPAAPAGWSSPANNSVNNAANTIGAIVFTKTAVGADAGAAFTVDFTGLNVYVYAIEVSGTYATDGVTPTLDGSIAFTASAGAVSSLNLSLPALSQNGEFIYCSAGTYFGGLSQTADNGIAFAAVRYTGPIPIVGYTQFTGAGTIGGIGGGANQMGLNGAYFGWHSTANLPTPGFFNGNTTNVLAVTYAIKAANPGVVMMGIWNVGEGVLSSVGGGYMPGSPTNVAGQYLFACVTQSPSGSSPVGQAVTAGDAHWVHQGQITDVSLTYSMDVFSRKILVADPTLWFFSVPTATYLKVEMVTVGLLDATTPADVVATSSQPNVNGGVLNAGGIVAHSIVPTVNDEMLLWFFGQRSFIGFGNTVVAVSSGITKTYFAGLGNGIFGLAAVAYAGVDQCGTQFCYDANGAFNTAGGAITLALKAGQAIVRPAANLRVDQMAIIALGLGAAPAPPVNPVGTFRGFGYDFGLKQWFIVDFPFSIRAASFMPQTIVAVAKAYQSLIAGANDGTIRRIFASNVGGSFGIDPDWDGTPIQTSMQFPDWGFPGTPVYVRRLNARITFDGGGATPKITGVTFNAVLRSGRSVTQTLNTPASVLSTIDVGVTVLSGNVVLKGQGQVLIEGTDAQVSDKQTGRIGQ